MIPRSIIRRDKAYTLMLKVESEDEQQQCLSPLNDMTLILKDIKLKDIGTVPKKLTSKEAVWETICVIARTASLLNAWTVPTKTLVSYLPRHLTLKELRFQWQSVQQKQSHNAIDLINILVKPTV